MERIKVLTAAVALGEFTVDELVSFSGVKRSTVRSVLDRNPDIVEQLGAEAPAGPGRPSSKWAVKTSEATREFIASIQALAPRPAPPSPVSVDDQHDAVVSVAEDALTRIADRDPGMQRRILRSAQATLHLVDSDPGAESADTADLWWVDDDSGWAIRARAVDALATLAVSPGERFADDALSETAQRVAAAMRAAPERGEAVYFTPFTQILASRGALSPLLMVAADLPPGLAIDRWTDVPAEKIEPDARVLTQRWAAPLVGVVDLMPLLLVVTGAAVAEMLPRTLELVTRWLERSRASARPALVMGDAGQVELVRLAARFGAPFVPADDWESTEAHELTVEAVSSTVERHATQTATGEHYGLMGGEVRADSASRGSSGLYDSLLDPVSIGSSTPAQVKSATRGRRVNIKPLEDKILVHAEGPETLTASGLVIPATSQDEPQKGTVVAVGPGRMDEEGERRIPLDVSEGDLVIYSKYGGTEIRWDSEQYLIVSARDVFAVVSREAQTNR
jgi:chaperonin GroES